jgi:hypothetical protein
MNETGSYPGQPWLWLYQLWYHVPGWRNSVNVDLIAIYMTGAATLLPQAPPPTRQHRSTYDKVPGRGSKDPL